MKIENPKCPTCGAVCVGTIERVTGVACIVEDESEPGTFEYEGGTEIIWDSQKTVADNTGRVTVTCDNGHEWPTHISEVE
jgi:hypothetical protein